MKKIQLLPFRIRLFLPFLIFVFTGFIFCAFTLVNEKQREKDFILDVATRIARIIAIQEEDLIETVRMTLITLAHEPIVVEGNPQKCNKFLSSLLGQLGRYTDFEITDTTGTIISSANLMLNQTSIYNCEYFQDAMNTGSFAVGVDYVDRLIGKPTIKFAYPIFNESRKKTGVVVVVVDFERLVDLEKRVVLKLPEGSTLTKIDRNGMVLVQYPNEHERKAQSVSGSSQFLEKVTDSQGIEWTTDTNGINYLNAYSQIKSSLFPDGISLILTISEELAFHKVNQKFYRNLLYLSVLGLIILLLVAISNELYLVRGLNAIRNAALQLKGGDLNTRVKEVKGFIEVKQLANTFNEMAGMIEHREIERKRTEEELNFRNTILFTQQETSVDGVLVVNEDNKVVLFNHRFVEMWGIPSELVDQSDDEPVLQFVTNKVANQQVFLQRVRFLYENKQETSHEEIVLKDGHIFERYTTPMIGPDSKYFGRIWYFHDITDRKRAEVELSRINRALRMLSGTNQALIHITQENELLNEACRIIIEVGGYQLAVVWFAESNEAKTLTPVAHTGFDLRHSESSILSLSYDERGQNPEGIAFRTGLPYISRNIASDFPLAPWKDEVIQHGCQSVIALPLICEGQTIGSLGIFSESTDVFDPKEIEILKEMAGDLAFGIFVLRTKYKKQQVEIQINEGIEFQSMAFRFSPIAIILFRAKDNIIIDVNEFVINNWGYSRDEIIGHTTEDLGVLVNHADVAIIRERLKNEGKIEGFEFDLRNKKKELRTVVTSGTFYKIKGENHYFAMIIDITERKKAEKALQASEKKYRIVADNTYNWEFWTDKDNNFIYCSPSCFRITGYTATEFIENPELRFLVVHPDYRSIFSNHVHQNYIEKSQTLQFKIIHKDGSERWIEHICQPVFDPEGNYMGQRGSNADITEKKEIDRDILSTVISTEESERNKFSQELHDGLGPLISTIKLYFQWLSEPNDPEKKKKIKEIGLQNIEEAILTVREISNRLSPRRLSNFGLVTTLKYLIQQVNETGKLSIDLIYDIEQRYNPQIEITLYRILSELLNNTIKYAAANKVVINLTHNYEKNYIQIVYTDNGKGFNFDKVLENKKGMGLYNMTQRIETMQGFINFNTEEGKPLNVTIELPIINVSQT